MTPAPTARLVAIVVACVVWGSSFLFGKVALESLAVAHVVLGRFALATAVLVPAALVRGALPRRRDLPLLLATGTLGVPVTFLLQFEGLARTSVTSASLLVAAGAPLLALASAAFHGDRLDRAGWGAIAVSTVGVSLLVGLPGPGRTTLGDALVFLSMVTVTGYVLLSVRLLRANDALGVTAWSFALGTLVLAPVAWIQAGPPPLTGTPVAGVASVVVLGLACTALTYVLWNWGLTRVSAARAGVYLNLEPVVGALLGVLLLGDVATAGLAGGGALAVLAAVWISLPARPGRAVASAREDAVDAASGEAPARAA